MSALIHLTELSGYERERNYRAWIKQRFGGECTYCGCQGKTLTIDHVTPISRGGTWHISNLAPACPKCNNSKSNHDVWQWWEKQPFWDEHRGDRLRAVMNEQPRNIEIGH